jgi:hypothetical protein
MKIRYLTGPGVGTVAHVENQTGTALINAGLAEVYFDRSAPVVHKSVEPKWAVEVIGNQYPCLAITLQVGPAQYSYTGEPGKENERKEWNDGRIDDGRGGVVRVGGGRYIVFGRAVPDEISAKYKKAWKQNKALRGGTNSAEHAREAAENFREEQFKQFEIAHAPGTLNPYAKTEAPPIHIVGV